jgi:3-dehydroquinate dehydratase-2
MMENLKVMELLLLHGPNLNMLGVRQPEIYGRDTLDDINTRMIEYAKTRDVSLRCHQSNHEGALIDTVQEAKGWASGIVINPGAYTHTSIALRDAISATTLPTVEIHLSNIHAREEFRHHSMLVGVCIGQVMGFGAHGYRMALDGLITFLEKR